MNIARPDQDIVFSVQSRAPKLFIFTAKQLTTGRLFYQDGKLNIIIGTHNHTINDSLAKTVDPSGQLSYRGGGLDFGDRSSSFFGFKEDLIDVAGVENKRVKNKKRKDWILIDLKAAAEAQLAKKNRVNQQDFEQGGGVIINDDKLQLEAARLAKQRREMRAEMARMRKEMKEKDGSSEPKKTIEERITTLDDLFAKELISQEEYDDRRQAILNDI